MAAAAPRYIPEKALRVAGLGEEAKKTLLTEVKKALVVDGEMTNSEKYFLERVETLLS